MEEKNAFQKAVSMYKALELKKRLIVLGIGLAVLIALFFCIKGLFLKKSNKLSLTSFEMDIKEFLPSSTMFFAEIPYKGLADWENEKGKSIGYVSYKGVLKFGVNIDEMRFEWDSESKNTILVIFPDFTVTPILETGEIRVLYKDAISRTINKDNATYRSFAERNLAEKGDDAEIRASVEKYAEEFFENLLKPFFEGENYSFRFIFGKQNTTEVQ